MLKTIGGALPDLARQERANQRVLFFRRKEDHPELKALLAEIRQKSCETTEHSERMADLAWRIGQRLGLPADRLQELVLLADVHDIGKTVIPEAILNKAGQLDDNEWFEMKQHPVIGQKIALVTPGIEHLADGILYHHERWDGRGYPHGLAGSAIPLSARIIAVVDAFDAMTHDRPYRPAMGIHEATRELQLNAGSQFDPDVISAFVQLMRKYL